MTEIIAHRWIFIFLFFSVLLASSPLLAQRPAPGKYGRDSVAQSLAIDGNALKLLQRKLKKEPSVDVLIAAALRTAHAGPGRSDDWSAAVRRAALLPTLKVSTGYDLERDESLDRTQDKPDSWGADTDNDFGIQVTAQWNLPELIYCSDELKVYQTIFQRTKRREEIISTIIGYYFERRRLQYLEVLRPAATMEERVDRMVRLKELSALIDSLTGGVLTRRLI